jgi:hypothetical protein
VCHVFLDAGLPADRFALMQKFMQLVFDPEVRESVPGHGKK